MDRDQEPRPSPVEWLPVEIARMILSALPDVASLRDAVLSSRLFYQAFLAVKMSIKTTVLKNQIDVSVLTEAMAAVASSLLNPHDTRPKSREAIFDFDA